MSSQKLAWGLFLLALFAGQVSATVAHTKAGSRYEELDESNFESFIDSNDFVLVMYYGTFSKKSSALLTTFTGLTLVPFLQKRNIKIARVNAGKYEAIQRKFMIEELPSFALFAYSVQIPFKDKFSQRSVLRFLQERLLYREEEVRSLDKISYEHHDFAIAYYATAKDTFLTRAMRGIKMKHYSWNIYRLQDGSYFKGKDGIVAIRHHDSYKSEYAGNINYNAPAIERFLVDSEFPDWSLYNKKTQHWIEEEGYPVLAVLYDGHQLPNNELTQAAKTLGKQQKHNLITVFVRRDQSSSSAAPILRELAGEDLSTIDAFIIAPTTPYHKKYILRHDYKAEIYSTTKERLSDFVTQYERGHLDRFHMTEIVDPAKKQLGPNIQTLRSFLEIAGKFKSQPGIHFYTYDTDKNESEIFEYFSPNRVVFFEPQETYHKEYKLDANLELTFDQFAGFLMQNLG